MRPRSASRGGIAAAAIVSAACLLAGLASAYWIAGGAGNSSAAAGSSVAVTLGAGTPTSTLVPGGSADVAVSVANPNTQRVFLGSLALDTSQGTGGFAVDGGHAGCNVAALSFTTQTNGGAGWLVPGSTTSDLDLTGAISLATSAVSACQGAQVTVYLQAGP